MATTDVSQNLVDIKEIVYTDKILGLTNVDLQECQFPADSGALEWRKAYTLTIPKLPSSIASVTIKRTSSDMTGVSTATWTAGSAAQSIEVRFGDVLTISATTKTGYSTPVCGLALSAFAGEVEGSFCTCCGAKEDLILLDNGQAVCESCHESWG